MLAIGLGSFATVNAASQAEVVIEQEPKQEKKMKEVAMKDLPMEVQKDVKQKYPDAEFVTANKMEGADGDAQYEVVLDNAGQEMRLTYDAKGNAVKSNEQITP